ncbi:hypothetical protein BJX63DRAFT_429690 [Aspergillus granulosus]|uniref:Uncharacterized protein n=1 Tax=Aspergillus granulosus TaxID=176169 RepID=A0ABR4HSD7_9EURO
MNQPGGSAGRGTSSLLPSPSSQVPHPPYSYFDHESMRTTDITPKSNSEISDECHSRNDERHSLADLANNTSPDADMQIIRSLEQPIRTRSRSQPSLAIWHIANDGLRAPTLAAKSLDLQTREMFNSSLRIVLIPATFAAFTKRVDQDIVAFVRDDQRAQCPPIEWSVRCYATWHLATIHGDKELLGQSRYIYGVLLRYLRSALDDPRKQSSETTLTVAVLLGIYEIFDGTSPGGWVVHVRVLKEILKRRGAAAHFAGFSRTIVLSCRAFLIAEAFVSCEECFLAEREWMDVNARAFEREERKGRGCTLVSLIERTYREVVRVPGLVARTKRVVEAGGAGENGERESREQLRGQIQRSQAGLRRLRRSFTSSLGVDGTPDSIPGDSRASSIVDPRFIPTITQHNLFAIRTVEELLGRLSVMLSDTKQSGTESTAPGTNTSDTTPALPSLSGSATLDLLFLSLGAIAL